MSTNKAISVLDENSKVLYGIFGVVETNKVFPPFEFLNEFLMQGSDPCDQDGRMNDWQPFKLSPSEYEEVKLWWFAKYPDCSVDDFGETCWQDWSVELIDRI